jgi:hypothetical protein
VDNGNYSSVAGTIRPVSASIRCWAQLAATDKSGVADALNYPNFPGGIPTFALQTQDSLSSKIESKRLIAIPGVMVEVSWRPQSVGDYAYLDKTDATIRGTMPYIAFDGLPVNTNVFYECVVHSEFTPSLVNNIGGTSHNNMESNPTLAQSGTIEQVAAMAKTHMGIDIVDRAAAVVTDFANVGSTIVGSAAQKYSAVSAGPPPRRNGGYAKPYIPAVPTSRHQ